MTGIEENTFNKTFDPESKMRIVKFFVFFSIFLSTFFQKIPLLYTIEENYRKPKGMR